MNARKQYKEDAEMRKIPLLISSHIIIISISSRLVSFLSYQYENTPIQIYTKFHLKKLKKNILIFLPFLFKILSCGYSLEPPRRCVSNEYPHYVFEQKQKKNNVYPCKPQCYYIKVGFKGVNII